MATTYVLTAADVERMGSAGERMELIDGELREKEPMGGWHGEAQIEISGPLHAHVKRGGLGRIYPSDTQFRILRNPDIILIPDIAFVRAERLPQRAARKGIMPLAPELAVEVVSPNDRRSDLMVKVEQYERAGVPLIWLVDERRRSVEVRAIGHPSRMLRESDLLDGGEVVPEFQLPVADIFR
ncbi:MAG TPA: Uma2 family endonuclease [Methylomirabilota bacterium]|nr:Uma2 family endonuclease [Methylomirabilota bacterium]